MSQLLHRSVLLAKVEGTYNTDSVPVVATDAILVENLKIQKANVRMYKRLPARSSQGKLKPLYAGHLMSITFDTEVKGSGAAGTAPEIGPLLRGCGWSETVVPSTSVTYKPASSAHASLSMYGFRDGKRNIVTGARGQPKGMIQVGEAFKISWSFLGHHVSETDTTPGAQTYDTTLPIPVLNAGVSFDSFSGVFTKIEWDQGVQLAVPADINKSDGYGEIQIIDRDFSASIDPEDVLVATYDFLTKFKTGAVGALNTGGIGSVAGNRWQVTCPAATIEDDGHGEREGQILTRELKLGLHETSALDDEMSIIFT